MRGLASFGSIPLALAAVALVLGAAYILGSLAVPSRPSPRRFHLDAHLLRTIAGLNLVGLLGITLSLFGLLSRGRSIWLLGGLNLLLLAAVARRSRRKRNVSRHPSRCSIRSSRPGLAAIALLLALITLAPALCPPSGWDELVYHEALPQRWLASGGPAFFPDLPYSGFPALGEILFWLAAPIEGVIAPRLLNWVCWILGLACLYRLLRRYLAVPSAAAMMLAFPLNETMLLIAENCYVETIVMMNIAAALLAVRSMRPSGVRWWATPVVLGLLVGGTVAVKLTGVAAIAVPCLWYAGAVRPGRSGWLGIGRALGTCLLTVLVVAFPFYLRPWLVSGNPFYPYFCDWFSADAARLEMSRYHHALGGFGFGVHNFAAFIDGPLLLAFRSDNYDGRFGWQFLGFAGLAIAALLSTRRRRSRRVVLWPAAVAAWFYVFWFVTAQQARFAIPAAVALVILAAVGLRRIRGAGRQVVLLILAIASLASVPWERTGYYWYSALAAVGAVNRADYVHNMTDTVYLPLVQAIDALTPSDSRLMLLYEHRGFYMPRDHVIGTPLFQEGPFTLPQQYSRPGEIVEVLHRMRITHVVLPKAAMGPDQTDDWLARQRPFLDALDACVFQGWLRPVWKSEVYLLLEVQPRSASGSISSSGRRQ